ncbi:MAG: hypothetical protein ACP5M5_14255 [Acidibrevibacterium sp.]|uniref:hypothetical protein n=1 Tax=Acidibrevibacterium sp. TaxID=2606776 RepID=UPI003D0046A1
MDAKTAPQGVTIAREFTDKLHNARAIVSDGLTHGATVFQRFSAGRDGVLWYYSALADVFAQRLPGPLSRDLSRAVADMRAIPE